MDRKKVPLFIGAAIVLLIVILVIAKSCKKNGNGKAVSNNGVTTNCCPDSVKQKSDIQKVKIYLETSLSMRGFAAAINNKNGDYKLKELTTLISKMTQKGLTYELYTVSDKPVIYKSNVDDYNKNLSNGQIFGDGQSRLQNSICSVIDSLKNNQVSMFISDCIIDLGSEGININDLSIATSKLLNHIIQNKNLSVLVFQYYSDFNGSFYYNCENNKGLFKKPYQDSLMHKRPFYLWIFGNSVSLKKLIQENTFNNNFVNCYSYNLNFNCCDVDFQILPYMQKGKMIIGSDYQSIKFKDFSRENDFSFTIGLDLSGLPDYAKTNEYLINEHNLSIIPDYLNQNNLARFDIKTLEQLKSDPTYSKFASIVKPNLTHFVTITFTKLNGTGTDYKLIFKQTVPKWFSVAHITDDRNLSLKAIEGKTFGFNSITNAFEQGFEKNKVLLEIPFNITK